jgi:hypothetical protein
MIVWTGLGFVVAVIVFVCLMMTQLVVNVATKDVQYYTEHGWPKLVGYWVAAAVVWPVIRHNSFRQFERVEIDPATGERRMM